MFIYESWCPFHCIDQGCRVESIQLYLCCFEIWGFPKTGHPKSVPQTITSIILDKPKGGKAYVSFVSSFMYRSILKLLHDTSTIKIIQNPLFQGSCKTNQKVNRCKLIMFILRYWTKKSIEFWRKLEKFYIKNFIISFSHLVFSDHPWHIKTVVLKSLPPHSRLRVLHVICIKLRLCSSNPLCLWNVSPNHH
jgi:hypothetical protein